MCWSVSCSPTPAPAQEEYLIGGGDTLQVNVWKNTELSQTVIVRPDGQITLPLIRDVKAQGLTAMQLGQVLAEKLSSFVNAPNVTVTVSGPTSFRVYTQGAIANGVHSLAAPITARQLLARAGGATADADLARAYVLRGEARIPVDLSIAPRAGQKLPASIPLLAPGDILAIPVREVTLGRVLVVGEVAQPHALPYVEGMTLLDAYLGAGGGTPAADLKNARIARQRANGETTEIPVDIDELLKRGALEKNIVIAPGDIVIVPFRQPEERILVVGEVRTPTDHRLPGGADAAGRVRRGRRRHGVRRSRLRQGRADRCRRQEAGAGRRSRADPQEGRSVEEPPALPRRHRDGAAVMSRRSGARSGRSRRGSS